MPAPCRSREVAPAVLAQADRRADAEKPAPMIRRRASASRPCCMGWMAWRSVFAVSLPASSIADPQRARYPGIRPRNRHRRTPPMRRPLRGDGVGMVLQRLAFVRVPNSRVKCSSTPEKPDRVAASARYQMRCTCGMCGWPPCRLDDQLRALHARAARRCRRSAHP